MPRTHSLQLTLDDVCFFLFFSFFLGRRWSSDALLDDVEDPASAAHAVNEDEAALASLDAELAELEGDDMHSDNGGTSDKREFDELDEAALLDGDDDDDWDTL